MQFYDFTHLFFAAGWRLVVYREKSPREPSFSRLLIIDHASMINELSGLGTGWLAETGVTISGLP